MVPIKSKYYTICENRKYMRKNFCVNKKNWETVKAIGNTHVSDEISGQYTMSWYIGVIYKGRASVNTFDQTHVLSLNFI